MYALGSSLARVWILAWVGLQLTGGAFEVFRTCARHLLLELGRVEDDVLSLYNNSLSLDSHAGSTGSLVLARIFLAGIVTNYVFGAC